MYCRKPSPLIILLLNTLIVAIVFMILDYLFYGLICPGPDPYAKDLLSKIIFTLLLSFGYAHLYNKASRMWRPNTDDAFLFKKKAVLPADLCKISWAKLLNGIVFSLFMSFIIVMAMWLSTFVLSTIFLYVLHGYRGLPDGSGDTVILVTKIVIAGVTIECIGKTESDPDRI